MNKTKVSAIAESYGVTPWAIYNLIKTGVIPETCILRLGGSIRIKADEFDRLAERGELQSPRKKAQGKLVGSATVREAAAAVPPDGVQVA